MLAEQINMLSGLICYRLHISLLKLSQALTYFNHPGS